jgi:hypothetical protein
MNHDVLQEMFSDVSPETGYENLPFYEAGVSQEVNSLFEDEYMGEVFPESGMPGSFESLFENDAFPEWEDEGEGLFETTFSSEWEMEGGFAQELDREFDYAAQQEADMFFSKIIKAVKSPAFRNIAKMAARAALKAGSVAFPVAAPVLGLVQSAIKEAEYAGGIASGVGSAEGFYEYEDESYYEIVQEIQSETNPAVRAYAEAMMEHLGIVASESESEDESLAFLAPLVPLAAKALPAAIKMAPNVLSATAKVAPMIMKGVQGIGKSLLNHPDTKKMVNSLPTIVKGTVTDIARHVAKNGTITGNQALRYLAGETAKNLSNPHKLAQNYQKAKAGSRKYTQARQQIQAKQPLPRAGQSVPSVARPRPNRPYSPHRPRPYPPHRPQGMTVCCNCGCRGRR